MEARRAVVLINYLANSTNDLLSGALINRDTYMAKAIFSTLLSSGLLGNRLLSEHTFGLLCSLLDEREDILSLQEDIRKERSGNIVELVEDEMYELGFGAFFWGKEDLVKYSYCSGLVPRMMERLSAVFEECLVVADSKEAVLFNELVKLYIDELTSLIHFYEQYAMDAVFMTHGDTMEYSPLGINNKGSSLFFVRNVMNCIRYYDLSWLLGTYIQLYNQKKQKIFLRVAERWNEKREQ